MKETLTMIPLTLASSWASFYSSVSANVPQLSKLLGFIAFVIVGIEVAKALIAKGKSPQSKFQWKGIGWGLVIAVMVSQLQTTGTGIFTILDKFGAAIMSLWHLFF